jgi:hypothetical protein
MTFRIAVLAGAAVGLSSALFFLSLVIGAGPFVPLVISAAACALLARWARIPVTDVPSKAPIVWLQIAFFVVAAVAAVSFIMLGFKEPHGAWDAWSIWNLHARFLERGATQWTALFSKQLTWSHPGYPLLLPAFIAQLWTVLRSETTWVPFAGAFLFTFGTAAALIGAVRQLRGWDQALIAGAVLLGTSDYIVQGAAQYADIPLSFYILSSLALLCFDDIKCTILAGAMAGFAAWTKNEGLLFVLVLIAARLIARWRAPKASRPLLQELVQLALGAAPVLLVLAFFKFRYAPADELLSAHKSTEILSRAFDVGRYITVIQGYVTGMFQFGDFVLPVILILVAYAWLVRFKIAPDQRMAVTTVLAAVMLMLAGDFMVYVLLSNDVVWQINTSMARLFMQVWPAALLGFFLATAPVDLRPAPPPETKKQVKKTGATRRR